MNWLRATHCFGSSDPVSFLILVEIRRRGLGKRGRLIEERGRQLGRNRLRDGLRDKPALGTDSVVVGNHTLATVLA